MGEARPGKAGLARLGLARQAVLGTGGEAGMGMARLGKAGVAGPG